MGVSLEPTQWYLFNLGYILTLLYKLIVVLLPYNWVFYHGYFGGFKHAKHVHAYKMDYIYSPYSPIRYLFSQYVPKIFVGS
jgi:fumarate reductase subunit D